MPPNAKGLKWLAGRELKKLNPPDFIRLKGSKTKKSVNIIITNCTASV